MTAISFCHPEEKVQLHQSQVFQSAAVRAFSLACTEEHYGSHENKCLYIAEISETAIE